MWIRPGSLRDATSIGLIGLATSVSPPSRRRAAVDALALGPQRAPEIRWHDIRTLCRMTDWRFDVTVNEMGDRPILDLRVDVRVMERFALSSEDFVSRGVS